MHDWDYRVIKNGLGNFYITEVYYDEAGNIVSWSDEAPDLLILDDYENLKGTVEEIALAFGKPTLTFEGVTLVELAQ